MYSMNIDKDYKSIAKFIHRYLLPIDLIKHDNLTYQNSFVVVFQICWMN